MPIRAFVDESGTPGDGPFFVMAGLIGHSENWVRFDQEWQDCLNQAPRVRYFKMSECAGLGGQFWGWSKAQRDARLRSFAQIINRHAKICTHSIIDLKAHEQTWKTVLPKPMNEAYFWPFQNTILASCFALWDAGWRERFEIIFDRQAIFGPRARMWYPAIKQLMKEREPDAYSIMPDNPMFSTDQDFMALQAADLYAWCFRRGVMGQSEEFEWLLGELTNVTATDYSQVYDLERMQAVLADTNRLETKAMAARYLELWGGGLIPRRK